MNYSYTARLALSTIGFVLGFGLIVYALGWIAACGIFIALTGNNYIHSYQANTPNATLDFAEGFIKEIQS